MGTDKTQPPGGNMVRLYANMVSALEKIAERKTLGDLFARLRASGESRSLPLDDDGEIPRMLARVGIIDSGLEDAAASKLVEEFVRDMADAVSRTPAQVSLVLRLYAAGMYGIIPSPICGSVPRCKACAITKDCDYYNAPPKGTLQERIPLFKRFTQMGHEAVSDEEIVALIVGGMRCGEAHMKIARDLLERYGSLRAISAASHAELCRLRDITPAVASRIAAASAFHVRVNAERRSMGPQVRSSKDFYDLYYASLRDLKKEAFIVVFLDQKNRVIGEERVSEGSLTNSIVHPREVFARAVRESVASVAFVHNHPSGDSTPSPEDIALTKRLCEAGKIVGISVLDHVVVGEGSYTSFLDDGMLDF